METPPDTSNTPSMSEISSFLSTTRKQFEGSAVADSSMIENEENDVSNDADLDLLMDEAKTMYSIGGYHENIINLQGISYTPDFKTGNLRQVSVNYVNIAILHFDVRFYGVSI